MQVKNRKNILYYIKITQAHPCSHITLSFQCVYLIYFLIYCLKCSNLLPRSSNLVLSFDFIILLLCCELILLLLYVVFIPDLLNTLELFNPVANVLFILIFYFELEL